MKIDQYYLECLSQASYLIADEEHGVAAVVDPRRDVEVYLRDAAAAGVRIEYIIETHFHADFLSGHLELAEATGAEIIFGDAASPNYPARLVSDGETIQMGSVELEFLATPGHTPESISVVVRDLSTAEGDERPEPAAVLTGDTLFIGDVGRPDLLASVGVTAEELGASLYDSLHTKLMTLPDQTLVYPAHGAGSACGKNLSTETVSTIGEQKRTNYALGADERRAVHRRRHRRPAVRTRLLLTCRRDQQGRPRAARRGTARAGRPGRSGRARHETARSCSTCVTRRCSQQVTCEGRSTSAWTVGSPSTWA